MVVLNSAPRPARRRDPPAARVSGCEQRFRTQLARGRGRRVGAHGRRALHARRRRLGGRAPALVRGELLRPRGLAGSRPGRPRRTSCGRAPAASCRSASGTRGSAGRTSRALDRHVRAAASRRRASAGRTPSSSGRRPTGLEPAPLDVRDPRTRNLFRLDEGQMELDRLKAGARRGRADRLREHGDGAARLQRDRGEDAGRPASRRPAAHDVHGRVRARRRRAPARPPARGGVLDPRGRGRGARRRRAVHAAGRRRLLDRRRLHPRVLQPHRRARALARDPVAAAAGAALLPLQPRLGVPAEPHRGCSVESTTRRRSTWQSTCPTRSATQSRGRSSGSRHDQPGRFAAGVDRLGEAEGRQHPRSTPRSAGRSRATSSTSPHVALSWVDPENGYHTRLDPGPRRRDATPATRRRPTSTRSRRSTSASRRIRGARRASSASRS